MLSRLLALTAGVLFAASGSARADTISFSGSQGSGTQFVSFGGTMDVTVSGGGTIATIQVTIQNTTPASSQAFTYGYITGFGLNIPNSQQAKIASATGSSTDADFRLLSAAADSTGLQAGEFDYAFSTDSTAGYQLHTVGFGDISKGLGAGQSATFTITLSALAGQTFDASVLTALNVLLDQSTANGGGAPFSARFRSTNTSKYWGLDSPDGNKVPVGKYHKPPVGAVPAPPAVVLAGVGVACCLFGRAFRRKTLAPAA
jgi:hypothetical protein